MTDVKKNELDYWTRQVLKGLASIVVVFVGVIQAHSYSQMEILSKKLDLYIEDKARLEGKVNAHDYRLDRNELVLYDLSKKHQKN